LQTSVHVLSKGAEADIYRTRWFGNDAVSKIRVKKTYRQKSLDNEIRRNRTLREATMLSNAKETGVRTPFIYFVDPISAEIVMEFIEGINAKEKMDENLALQMGRYAGLLHINNLIHNDLTTSNFINSKNNQLVLLDFGLSFFSERLEDKAVDIRLVKEVFSSFYACISDLIFSRFLLGYSSIISQKDMSATLRIVHEIEQRGRYSRVT
jgi:TP53 regulating kinase and related kinases